MNVTLGVVTFSNSSSSMNMTRINYAVCIHGWVSICVVNRNCFPKMTDFSRLGALTGSQVYRKSGSMKEMVQDRHVSILDTESYRFVPFPMTLNDLEGHSPVAGFVRCNSTNILYDTLLILQYQVSTTLMDLIVVFCIVSCLYLCLRWCVSLPNFR